MRRWRGSPNCPTSSASRTRPTTWPGRSRCGWRSAASSHAVGRGRDRGRLSGAGRRRLHLGHRQCRAGAAAREMHEAWQKGDVATVRRINERLIPLHDALFAETSPAPVKYAASLLGRCAAEVRQPLWQTTARDAGAGGAPRCAAPGCSIERRLRAGRRRAGGRPLCRAEPSGPARLPDRGHARSRPRPARHRGQGVAQGPGQHRRGLCRRSRRRTVPRQCQHPGIRELRRISTISRAGRGSCCCTASR